MLDPTNMAGDRLTIHVDTTDLPTEDDAIATLAVELGDAIRDVLDAHNTETNRLRCHSGYTYAAIPADCPICGTPVHLTNFELDYNNGAHATARCEGCNWTGDAIYRLIDYHNREESGLIIDPQRTSSVHLHDITPQHTPY